MGLETPVVYAVNYGL